MDHVMHLRPLSFATSQSVDEPGPSTPAPRLQDRTRRPLPHILRARETRARREMGDPSRGDVRRDRAFARVRRQGHRDRLGPDVTVVALEVAAM